MNMIHDVRDNQAARGADSNGNSVVNGNGVVNGNSVVNGNGVVNGNSVVNGNGHSHVQGLMQTMAKDSTVRGFQTADALPFHTDGSDFFMLMCLTQGRSGGKTSIVSAVHVFNEIVKSRPDLAIVLQQPFHFDARGQRTDGKKCQVHPIFQYHAGRIHILAKEPYIHSAQRFTDVPRLTKVQLDALRLLKETMEDKSLRLEFGLQPGEIIVCSNHSLVHSRTAFKDDPNSNSNPAAAPLTPARVRHMLRLWLTSRDPRARPLPPHYANTREYGSTYARRCSPSSISLMTPDHHHQDPSKRGGGKEGENKRSSLSRMQFDVRVIPALERQVKELTEANTKMRLQLNERRSLAGKVTVMDGSMGSK